MFLFLALFTIKLTSPQLWLASNFTDSHSTNNPRSCTEISSSLFSFSSLSQSDRRFLHAIPSNHTGCTNIGLLMLAVCGDVQANPGPIANPCMGCSQPVAKTHRSMDCDRCRQKIHIRCAGVTPSDYKLFQAKTAPYPWSCPRCDVADNAGNASDSSSNSSFSADSEHSNQSTDTSTNGQTDYRRVDPNIIKVLKINLNSVFSKAKGAALIAKIVDSRPDIIIGNESELTNERVDSDFLPPGYSALRLDKTAHRHGVFVAFRDELVVTQVPINNKDPKCEFVLAKLEIVGKPDLYIGSFYRHTNSDSSSLKSLYDQVLEISGGQKLPNMIIGGDFNLPDADWVSGTYSSAPQYGNDVNEKGLEYMSNLFMTQMVSNATRGKNTLDLLFATCPDLVENVSVQPGISDHDAVEADVLLTARVTKKKPRLVYEFGKADPVKVRTRLEALGKAFRAGSRTRDVDGNWKFFTEGIHQVVQDLVPTKFVRERHNLPCIGPRLRKNIKRKNRTYWKARNAPFRTRFKLWEQYRQQERSVRRQIKAAHDAYMDSLFEDDDGNLSKMFYKAVKAKKRDSVGVSPLRTKNGKLDSTPRGKATILSDQYSSVFKKDSGKPQPPTSGPRMREMPRIKVTVKGVELLLQKLNPRKAVGPDKVPTILLKEHADIMAPILQVIYQQSLDSGKVPEGWKVADVVAVYKKGDKNTASNYRPVSLTSISCKCLEHIIFSNIMEHVDMHKILNDFQHGFRKQHSCETQLVTTIEDLAKGLDLRQQIDLLILDFSKAFDVVSHRLLLGKLEHYGVRGNTLGWVTDWLTDRTQRVVIDGECSEDAPVLSGVPQGTVLGPLMFILYINDISAGTNCSIHLFADDCLLYRVVDSTRDAALLQWDLKVMCRWADAWEMDFNPSKCYKLSITKRKCPLSFPYSINGVVLEHVSSNPYLGVELDAILSWNQQTKKTLTKSNRTLNLLRRNLHNCSRKTKETAYKTLVRPTLEYASSAWDPYVQKQIDNLEAVQNKAARFVMNDHSRNSSVSAMKETLQWRTLQERRFVARMTLWYKAIHQQAAVLLPSYYYKKPVDPSVVADATRESHNQQYAAPTATIDHWKYSFFQRNIRIWNILPSHLVAEPTDHPLDKYKYERAIAQFKLNLQNEFVSGNMHMVSPRGVYNRPRLGSTYGAGPVGPVY